MERDLIENISTRFVAFVGILVIHKILCSKGLKLGYALAKLVQSA